MTSLVYQDLTEKIIGVGIKVHRDLGPGFVEKVYQRALYLEFKNNGIKFKREQKIPIIYLKTTLGYQVVDFIIDDKILVEIKATPEIGDLHKAQMLSYLKASGKKLGLILNFGANKIEVKRVVN